ncbi:hypothetical protein F0562_001708 [Nyssa sinensis]|uniref:Uncharacterized protein n=1 Tax=Nyssa sinensis TaxID=561372 RepID=A0A5J5C5A7_9ASTE|nr:hypothetical protein F0562_001708 [Nyssa sinensis]
MAFSLPLHATINGLQVAKQHQSQGVSAAATINGSQATKQHHSHKVSTAHFHSPTVDSNFEDGEVYASTLVAEALDLEEEYGGFSVKPNFLFCSDNHFHEDSINGGSKTGGSKKVGQADNLAGASITAAQTSEGAHPNPYTSHGKAKGHDPLATNITCCGLQHLSLAILKGAKCASAHLSYPPHHYTNAESRKAQAPTGCTTVTVTTQHNTLTSPSSMGNTVASQHDGLISPSIGVACPSAKVGYSDTACPSTPNVTFQGQAPFTADTFQQLLPVPLASPVSIVGKTSQP